MAFGCSLIDVRSSRGADIDTDRCLMVAFLRNRLLVSKNAARKLDVERDFLNKVREVEFREQYRIQISNRFTALDNLHKCLSN